MRVGVSPSPARLAGFIIVVVWAIASLGFAGSAHAQAPAPTPPTDAVGGLAGAALDQVDATVGETAAVADETLNQVDGAASQVVDDAASQVDAAAAQVGGTTNQVSEAAGQVGQAGAAALQETVDQVEGVAGGAVDGVREQVEAVGARASELTSQAEAQVAGPPAAGGGSADGAPAGGSTSDGQPSGAGSAPPTGATSGSTPPIDDETTRGETAASPGGPGPHDGRARAGASPDGPAANHVPAANSNPAPTLGRPPVIPTQLATIATDHHGHEVGTRSSGAGRSSAPVPRLGGDPSGAPAGGGGAGIALALMGALVAAFTVRPPRNLRRFVIAPASLRPAPALARLDPPG